ncbi:hypothetical protein, partial [Escherichia coli]|uniref:hypothetical protein n=1 Tax=Escherichia coli TaxID=562 RepID=UPI0039E18988
LTVFELQWSSFLAFSASVSFTPLFSDSPINDFLFLRKRIWNSPPQTIVPDLCLNGFCRKGS